MSTFRIATLNVHLFENPISCECNIEQLVSILKPYKLDLIACQEVVNKDLWPKFCSLLDFSYQICNTNDDNYFGNGIACRYPIVYPSYQTTVSCPGELRSLLYGSIEYFQGLTIGVTHLDDHSELIRLNQIKELNPIEQKIDILMGDMNALTRNDYSNEYYQKIIIDKRKQANVEQPQTDLTNFIINQWNYEDAFKLLNSNLKDEQVVTSRFGTRIDYIYVQPRICNRWILSKCQIINTQQVTDHNAILTEFISVE